jgi:hypothetical protein
MLIQWLELKYLFKRKGGLEIDYRNGRSPTRGLSKVDDTCDLSVIFTKPNHDWCRNLTLTNIGSGVHKVLNKSVFKLSRLKNKVGVYI